MQADGSIVFDTEIQTDGLEKGFEKIKTEVGGVANAAHRAGGQIDKAFSGTKVSKSIENARAKVAQLSESLERVTAEMKLAQADDDDKGAAKLGERQLRLYDQLAEARRRLAVEIAAAAEQEAKEEERVAEREAAAKERAQAKQYNSATKSLRRFQSRMREIITGALFYNLFSKGLSAMTNYFGAALKSNDAFTQSFARLKGAILTAFQPIYEVALPALIALMNVLSAVVTAVGRFFAALSGRSYEQMKNNADALHKEAAGISSVGSAARKAKKALAGFDEINKLSFEDSSAGGGGIGGGIGDIDPDFADAETIENLNQILYLVGAVAAALLGWKIAHAFTDDLSIIAGVAMAAGGGFLMAANWADAFANGIDWETLTGMMVGFAVAVSGLAIAFGSTGAAVGLLVGGVALVVLAIKEWVETGKLGEESCVALTVGITAVGAAISLLTGGPFPAIIAAVAAFAIACVTNGEKVKEAFNGVLNWFKGIFQRDWREIFGETLGGILNGFSEGAIGIIDGLKQTFGGLVDFIKGVFTGDWNLALNGLIDIAEGAFGLLQDILLTPFRTLKDFVYNVAEKYLPDSWKKGINKVIEVVNKFVGWINDVLSFDINPIRIAGQTIYSGGSVTLAKLPKIPYLAEGAVIPANKPFLAMLGDQKHGTNVEAPLATIEEAVERVMARYSGTPDERIVSLLSQILEAILGIEIDGEVLSKAIDKYRRKEAVMRG